MSQDQISSGISGWCHATFIIIIYPKSLQSSCVLLPTPMNLAPLVSPAINFWRRDTAFLARKDSKTANSKPTAWQMNDFFDRGSSSNQHFFEGNVWVFRGGLTPESVIIIGNFWWTQQKKEQTLWPHVFRGSQCLVVRTRKKDVSTSCIWTSKRLQKTRPRRIWK